MRISAKLIAVLAVAIGLPIFTQAQAQQEGPLTVRDGDSVAHILPTVQKAKELAPPPPGTLIYHPPGVVMQPSTNFYAIFWLPASGKLQNGAATTLPALYQTIEKKMLGDYPGHGIANNSTQYFQTVGSSTKYIQVAGKLVKALIDTDEYPASGCNDPATPGNCITDAQLRTEITKFLAAHSLKGAITNMFLVYTSSGEGSCFTSTDGECSYTVFCAYHSFISGTTPIIYANMPFANLSVCQVSGTPSPNGDPDADAVASISTHEMTEAITDPELDAWFDSSGNEIGDLCNFNYGTLGWDSGMANQSWNADFFVAQQEFDNHTGACVQVGP
ncbi:MAG TPA: hypothetical protein VG033_05635 [Candidatus Acidoferrales bacterium]|nr:hypothetical protein [Candidatus Acidoferrales bacterium]